MSLFLENKYYYKDTDLTLKERLVNLSWSYIAMILTVVCIGLAVLYSISNGSVQPLVVRQLYRVGFGFLLFAVLALSDLRTWLKYAYWLYGISLILLIVVDVAGMTGMGAQRWLKLPLIGQLQPSELMKITLVLALARYFQGSSEQDVRSWRFLIIPVLMMAIPVILIWRQPDLGTALMLCIVTVALLFLVGVQYWKFALLGGFVAIAGPIAWHFLHDYQKSRVLIFLNPESDPLGAGYHIMQSKITLGSGGLFGKGFMQGTQSHLNFIPENHTDFIFTVFAEEFGMFGGWFLLGLYLLIMVAGCRMALKSRNFFGKILALGLTVNFATYVFINIAMVMGCVPVVGIPLPLVSYGGSAMAVVWVGFGLIECVYVNREMILTRQVARTE
ncbi:MAG: rod shape-determining protein RodA [Alphaproteobacteria bacterium]|nr:rod shape-determining protein RodA [Alphaproteobacteria bacterium]